MASLFKIMQNSQSEPLIIEFTTTSANQTIKVPISGVTNYTIDWADRSTIESGSANYPTHTYTNAGVYQVKINGNFKEINSITLTPVDKSFITKVISWGDDTIGLTAMINSFNGCLNLNSIPSDKFKAFKNVTSFYNAFAYCSGLKGSIPSGLFNNCLNTGAFVGTFSFCSGLTIIPQGLFGNCPNVTNFGSTFSNCRDLTSIPQGLFNNCPDVTSFYGTFNTCTSLTGTTPTTNGVELWNRAGKSGYPGSINGNFCFHDCFRLNNFPNIPLGWIQ